MPKYVTLSGHEITQNPPPRALNAFFKKLHEMLENESVDEQAMIGFAYGPENPLLDHTLFAGRGAVTKDTLADPDYHVMADLLARKHAAVRGIDVEKIAAEHTVTVADAAERLGVHESAIRQAIAARRLPSWVKKGQYFIRPAALDSFRVGNRGPKPEGVGSGLRVRVGSEHGATLKLKVPGLEQQQRGGDHVVQGEVGRWSVAAIVMGCEGKLRYFEIVPSNDDNELHMENLYVIGKFQISRTINNAARAAAEFRTFEPS